MQLSNINVKCKTKSATADSVKTGSPVPDSQFILVCISIILFTFFIQKC